MEPTGMRAAYVTADGTFGTDNIILFHPDMLTKEQWNYLDAVGDNDRYAYTKAVLEGDTETVAQFEDEVNGIETAEVVEPAEEGEEKNDIGEL